MRGLQPQQRARSPGLPLTPVRPFKLLPVTAHALCSCAYHQDKSYFSVLFLPVRVGLSRQFGGGCGSPAVARGSPRPRAAPGSAGKGNAAQEAPAEPAGKLWGGRNSTQEGALGPGQRERWPRKGSERKGGSCSPPNVPLEPLLAFLRDGGAVPGLGRVLGAGGRRL